MSKTTIRDYGRELAQFEPDGYEDRYRDLWNDNMPRVSGHMYFAIPGEPAIHVTDEQAYHILTYLSEENR